MLKIEGEGYDEIEMIIGLESNYIILFCLCIF